MAYQIFLESLKDTALMLPWLFLAYLLIEIIEYRYGNKIRDAVQHAGTRGPIIGALAGVVPQCSFSVVGTALYSQRLATIGTLLAVYIATSDEAIPVILAQPSRADVILPLIATKFVLAVVVGFLLDYIYKFSNKSILKHIDDYEHGHDDSSHHHESILQVEACCGHEAVSPDKKFIWQEIIFHPLVHTIKIASYVFIASLFLGYLIAAVGQEAMQLFLKTHDILQPFVIGLLGLIPNCAASVAVTKFYLDGAITFGSVIAGLSASGGLGLLVLFRTERDKGEILRIILILYTVSVIAGLALNQLLK